MPRATAVPEPTTLEIDPHVHSVGSFDGHEPVARVLEAAAEHGLDGLVVTDHDAIAESRRAVELAPDHGLLALPGAEVSTRHGHLLAIGVNRLPSADKPFRRTVSRVREYGGVAVVPHPFQRLRHGVSKRYLTDCDGIETLNATTVLSLRHGQARAFADAEGYPRFGGSDAHVAAEIGRAHTRVDLRPGEEPTAEAVLGAFRRGATRAEGTRSRRRRVLRKYAHNAGLRSRDLVAGAASGGD